MPRFASVDAIPISLKDEQGCGDHATAYDCEVANIEADQEGQLEEQG